MKRLILAIPFLAVLVIAQQSAAQQGSVVRAGQKKSAQLPRPAAAVGNSIVQVVNSLVAAGAAKTKQEFETTEDFDERGRALASRYGQLSFLLPVRNRFEAITRKMTGPFTYDADTGRMWCFISTDYRWLDGFRRDSEGSQDTTIVLKSVLSKQGSYVGRNAFGATMVVKTSTTIEHGISVYLSSTVMEGLEAEGLSSPEYSYSFSLDSAQARALKPFLRVLVVGHLVEARVYNGSIKDGAGTLDMPYRDEYQGVYIPFSIDEIRILDIRSGKSIKTLGGKGEVAESGVHSNTKIDNVDQQLLAVPLPPPLSTPPDGDPRSIYVTPSNGQGSDRTIGNAEDGVADKVFRVDGGVTAPSVLFKVEPEYSVEALSANIQGTVLLYVEVDPSGKAVNMRVLHSLGLGLDEKAMDAVKKWKFKPGVKDGNAVTVQAQIEVSFEAR